MYCDNKISPAADETDAPVGSKKLAALFSLCGDFEQRNIDFGLKKLFSLPVFWIDGLISGDTAAESVLRPLTDLLRAGDVQTESDCYEQLRSGGVYCCSVKPREKLRDAVSDLCRGCVLIVFDGLGKALAFEARSGNIRSVAEPSLEKSLKGAKDSFVEVLRVNTALVRRRICSPRLKIAESSVGRKSRTSVAVLFVEGIADPEKVRELARRLDRIDIDALAASGPVEESIVDAPLSPFPQLIHTERPDRFAMYLLEGRIGLLIDGIPIGLVLPVTFSQFMSVTGDSNTHFLISTLLTALRYLALLLSLFLPAIYVAVAMYHQEMIPTRLLLSIIEAKQDVPFSTALEVLSMLTAFSLLQEAGLRLPNPIGDTVSIIGALIVGQSAVEARVVSPIAIIVVAVSGIACYTLPSQDLGSAVRLTRLLLLIAAILGGLFGVAVLSCVVLLHLSSIDSFGVNYTAPLSGGERFALARLLFRPPKPMNKFRDPDLAPCDRRRQK